VHDATTTTAIVGGGGTFAARPGVMRAGGGRRSRRCDGRRISGVSILIQEEGVIPSGIIARVPVLVRGRSRPRRRMKKRSSPMVGDGIILAIRQPLKVR
jgi:hypothetical protein